MASRLELGEDATSLGWFCVSEVVSGVWLLGEPQHVYTWLVAGDDRAVLLDTGMGILPIRASSILALLAPKIRYVKTPDGAHIAYSIFGEGPLDLVFVPGFASNVEHMWPH